VEGAAAHVTALDPFLSRLLRDGTEPGELVLIDEATGAVVACWSVRPSRRRS
jgi:hypothetical protein